jgi:electron transport complex protein RnfG|nr:FMN-binding protein [Candidatus Krumholzibacteria bacterium]
MREIGRLVLVLVVICSVSAGALAWVRDALALRIEQQSDFYVRGPALERLFGRPAAQLLNNKVMVDMGGVSYPVFFTRENGEVSGLAVEAPGHGGYAGDIVIMIGLDRARNQMLGVEIVSHGETPGVGAQVEKEAFRQQWQGLSANEATALRGEGGAIDAITGATFSSRAMVDGTNQVTALIKEHQEEILALIAAIPDQAGPEVLP